MAVRSESVSATDPALSIFATQGGILSTDQAIKLGIHPRTLYALRDNARLERMERGSIDSPMQSDLATPISSPSL